MENFYNLFGNQRKGLGMFLISCMLAGGSYAQPTNLIINGGGETVPVIGNGWTSTGTDFGTNPGLYTTSGPWYMSMTDAVNYSPDGDFSNGGFFFSVGVNRIPGGVAELFQDIDVRNYTGATGVVIVPFVLNAFLATDGQGDDAQLIVELRNAVGGVLATAYDSHGDFGGPFAVPFWFQSNPSFNSMAGTTSVRVRLIATNSGPGTIHAFFDSVSFTTNALPLPINLLSFQGLESPDHTVSLLWKTAQEENSSFIEVQRSAEGKNFTAIGKVPAAGNSNTVRDYSFVDGLPLAGSGSYRLRLVDLDGKSRYSRVVVVNTGASDGRQLELLGNPFHDHLGLRMDLAVPDQLTLTLTDLQGRVFLRQANIARPGADFIDVYPPAGIAAGIYLLNVRGASMNQTIRVLKQ